MKSIFIIDYRISLINLFFMKFLEMKFLFLFILIFCLMSRIFSQEKSEAQSYFDQAITLAERRNFKEAIQSYEASLKLKPDFYNAYFRLIALYEKLGMQKEALEYCNILIKKIPNDSLGYFIRADLLWDTNREQALSDLETAKKLKKDSCQIDFNMIIESKPYYSQVYYDMAKRQYSKWARPRKLLDDETRQRIGKQAMLCIDKAISFDSGVGYYHHLKAMIYEEMLNDIKSAIKEYDICIELELAGSWSHKYYFERRNELKVEIKDYAGAKSDYLVLHQKFPNDPDYLWELGNIETLLKNYDAAESYYSQVIKKRKYEQIDSYYPRARLRVEMKNYKGALEDYNRIFAIKSHTGWGGTSNQYYERANVKRLLKDYSGAIEDYNLALTISPYMKTDYGNYLYDRGNTKFLMQDYKGAYEDYTKAIEINSTTGIFYQARAYASIRMNDYQAAKKDLLFASDLLPENKEIQTDLEVLEILIRDTH